MDSVKDTPVKRRRTETGFVAGSQTYDSQDDSGDDLFKDHETVATLPLPRGGATPGAQDILSSPMPHITQPTQLIDRSIGKSDSTSVTPSVVQVAASSPIRSPLPSSVIARKPGGILANVMAPPGTAFRLPLGVTKPPQKRTVINLSDDEGPKYQGSSSEEDSQRSRRINIKPSTFIERAQKAMGADHIKSTATPQVANGLTRFQEITANSFYKPMEGDKSKKHPSSLSGSVFDSRNRDESNTKSRISSSVNRSADVMANAYGTSSRPPKQSFQTGPAKAVPVEDISLDDIADYQQRKKIERMRAIVPKYSVKMCNEALLKRRGHEGDALELLTSEEEHRQEIDLTLSDQERSSTSAPSKRKAPVKQQIKAPIRTIQEKWTATQSIPRNTQTVVSSPPAEPPKPRRRLVKGRKRLSSPVAESVKEPSPPRRTATPLSVDDSDSGVDLEAESASGLDGRLLTFFNSCSVSDLADIAEITEEVASVLLSQKPFRSLDDVRCVSSETKPGKRPGVKKAIGEKIVDKCLEMWSGYEAIDELVRQCEAIGKPVAEEMRKWGVDVFGASKDGELDLVDFHDMKSEDHGEHSSMRDSGIGTPTSTVVSADEDADMVVKRSSKCQGRLKQAFFPQPSIMGEGVVLKDYQIVGINWLSLLYQKQLSCILADDMGLGKTCQVIAFLAHLLEKGVKGPHLVVVPGSTLENWLREFRLFCPKLFVMPYYGKLMIQSRACIHSC